MSVYLGCEYVSVCEKLCSRMYEWACGSVSVHLDLRVFSVLM